MVDIRNPEAIDSGITAFDQVIQDIREIREKQDQRSLLHRRARSADADIAPEESLPLFLSSSEDQERQPADPLADIPQQRAWQPRARHQSPLRTLAAKPLTQSPDAKPAAAKHPAAQPSAARHPISGHAISGHAISRCCHTMRLRIGILHIRTPGCTARWSSDRERVKAVGCAGLCETAGQGRHADRLYRSRARRAVHAGRSP